MTADWMLVDVLGEYRLEATGSKVLAAGGVLKDGTNLLGMIYPGGQRLMRVSPHTDWAIEERYSGRRPKWRDRRPLDELWRILLAEQIKAGREVEREMGGRP